MLIQTPLVCWVHCNLVIMCRLGALCRELHYTEMSHFTYLRPLLCACRMSCHCVLCWTVVEAVCVASHTVHSRSSPLCLLPPHSIQFGQCYMTLLTAIKLQCLVLVRLTVTALPRLCCVFAFKNNYMQLLFDCPMEQGRPLYFCPVVSSVFLLFFPGLISVVANWMYTILPHMVWPQCEFKMQV